MGKTLLIILFLISSIAVSAQTENIRSVNLPQLEIKNKSLIYVLSDIEEFMSNKPNGFLFPITKVVFSEFEDLLCFHIVGIDNSWTDLFKFGELPYGYTVVNNRLYVITGEGYKGIDLSEIFYIASSVRTFSKIPLRPSGLDRSPAWFFEYRDEQAYLISVSDLDILN